MWPRSWRKRAGLVLFVVSLLPWLLLPVLPFLDWALETKALAAAGAVIVAEGLFVLALVLLGPEVVRQLKRVAKAALNEWRQGRGSNADNPPSNKENDK